MLNHITKPQCSIPNEPETLALLAVVQNKKARAVAAEIGPHLFESEACRAIARALITGQLPDKPEDDDDRSRLAADLRVLLDRIKSTILRLDLDTDWAIALVRMLADPPIEHPAREVPFCPWPVQWARIKEKLAQCAGRAA